MGRKRSYIPLNVFMGSRLVGQMIRESSGAISFMYDDEWLNWEYRMPISLSLPLRPDRYIGHPVIAVFENLLPDNNDIRKRVAERVGAEGIDAYSLLTQIGRDCVGALQFLPDGEEYPVSNTELTGRSLNDDQIEEILNDLEKAPLGLRKNTDFRISVAGAQEKTALLRYNNQWIEPTGTTPTTHIIKPQIGKLANGMDLTHSVENEHFCLTLLSNYGLSVAKTEITTFGQKKALVIERFDRHWAKDGRLIRLPQEDCCQALSIPPVQKYQSDGGGGIVEITKLLQGSDEPHKDQTDFFKANILFWLMGATDGHAKNFSIALSPNGRFKMTPFYDVLTVQDMLDRHQLNRKDMKLAMRIGKNNYYRIDKITKRHFFETGQQAGLSKPIIQKIINEIIEQSEDALTKTINAMPDNFPDELFCSVKNGVMGRIVKLKSNM